MMSIMSTGLSGLLSHQNAMKVTSNNIANAMTPGYSKQRVNFSTLPSSPYNGGQHIGNGVYTQSVTRMHDEMLWSNLKTASGNNSRSNEYSTHMNQVKDQLVGENLYGNNVTNMVDDWFTDLQTLADNPDNETIKSNLRSGGQAILDRGTMLNETLDDYKSSLVETRELLVNEANDYLGQLDDITQQIRNIEAGNGMGFRNDYANELRDQRDVLEKKLNDIGNFRVSKDNISTTGEHNVTDWGLKFNYNFSEDGGRLAGLDKSIESINNIQKKFNEAFDPVTTKIKEFLDSDMDNPNDLIQWNYDNIPSKNIGDKYVGFSSEVDSANSMANATSATMNSYQDRHDRLTKVNLDEETMNMMMYQRIYEANAKVIQTADQMLGTIINIKS